MDKGRLSRDKGTEIGELSLQAKAHEELLASPEKAADSCRADFPLRSSRAAVFMKEYLKLLALMGPYIFCCSHSISQRHIDHQCRHENECRKILKLRWLTDTEFSLKWSCATWFSVILACLRLSQCPILFGQALVILRSFCRFSPYPTSKTFAGVFAAIPVSMSDPRPSFSTADVCIQSPRSAKRMLTPDVLWPCIITN